MTASSITLPAAALSAPADIRALLDELAARADGWLDTIDPRPDPATLIETRAADTIRLLDTERAALILALRAAVEMAGEAVDISGGDMALRSERLLLELCGRTTAGSRSDARAIHALLAVYAPAAEPVR